jgi:DNA-binding transcriptional ArsR family regulator
VFGRWVVWHLPISRPAVSQHLRVLKDGSLVVPQQNTRRVYRLNPDGVAALRAYLDRRICGEAGAFGDKAGPQRPANQAIYERMRG